MAPSCPPLPQEPAAAGGAALPVKSLSELPAYPPDFVRRRLITFGGLVLGYSCFYLTRNSLTYTAPAMVSGARQGRAELSWRMLSWHSA